MAPTGNILDISVGHFSPFTVWV